VHSPKGTENATLIIKNNITVLQMVPIVSQDIASQMILSNSPVENVPKIEKLEEELTLKVEEREINGYDHDLRVGFTRSLYIFNTGDASVSF
jgi:hypothetical protein